MLGSYIAIILATVVIAPPASKSKNQIGANILVLEGDVVVGRYLVIQNESRKHWLNVKFTIDQGFAAERDLVQAGEKVTLFVKDFKKKSFRTRRGKKIPKMNSAPIDIGLTELRVECSEGEAVEPLVLRPSR